MCKMLLLVAGLMIHNTSLAEFKLTIAQRKVHLLMDADSNSETTPERVITKEGEGLFDPPQISASETGEGGSVSGTIDHVSDFQFTSSMITASMKDIGSGSSQPIENRGSLYTYTETRVEFTSDTAFLATLTGDFSHSSGTQGNAWSRPYGVRIVGSKGTIAGFNLLRPGGSLTVSLPPGSYFLDSDSGVNFDAVFGVPPAASYNSTFSSEWTFSATEITTPRLSIDRVDDAAIQISWLKSATGYELQSTPTLATEWVPVSENISSGETINEATGIQEPTNYVTVDPSGVARFFRLHKSN